MARYVIVVVALIVGGWMFFDGARALVTGSYTTPGSGAYAGQLGPWARLVESAGLDPRGLALKLAHVILGASWLAFGLLVFRGVSFAWWFLLATAILSLWYLPFGTIAGAVVVVALLLPSIRSAG